MRKLVVLVALLGTLAAAASAGGAVAKRDVGKAKTLTGLSNARVQVTLLKVVNDATPEEFREPKAGNRVVALKLKLKNLTARTYEDYVTNGARLVDARGKTRKAPALGSVEPHLGQIKLARNGTATGWITFEVPEGVAISKFKYELNSGFGGQVATWRLR
ncbi:MAG: DUF4352 domain-containing protein [Thermoleophilia bacterium]